jgi:hypothetical protein
MNSTIVGTSNPAQAAYDHLKEDFQGQSPVVCVGSAGMRPIAAPPGGWGAYYQLEILMFVAREDEEVSEDALDDVAEAVFGMFEDNKAVTEWRAVEFETMSNILPVVVGGDPYWMETLPVVVVSR